MPEATHRRRPYAIVLALATLIGGFALLADEVAEGDTTNADRAILMALRDTANPSLPIGPAWLREAARDVTSLGSFSILFIFVAIVVLYLLVKHRPRTAMLLVGSVLCGTLLSNTLKMLFNRARPDLPGVPQVFTASFPSGHAALSAVVYLTLGLLLAQTETDRRTKGLIIGVAIFLTFVVGLSRVYIGVHFPTDVIAGWCLGIAWAIGSWLLLDLWRERTSHQP